MLALFQGQEGDSKIVLGYRVFPFAMVVYAHHSQAACSSLLGRDLQGHPPSKNKGEKRFSLDLKKYYQGWAILATIKVTINCILDLGYRTFNCVLCSYLVA